MFDLITSGLGILDANDAEVNNAAEEANKVEEEEEDEEDDECVVISVVTCLPAFLFAAVDALEVDVSDDAGRVLQDLFLFTATRKGFLLNLETDAEEADEVFAALTAVTDVAAMETERLLLTLRLLLAVLSLQLLRVFLPLLVLVLVVFRCKFP